MKTLGLVSGESQEYCRAKQWIALSLVPQPGLLGKEPE